MNTLRPAACRLSLWLNDTMAPGEIAARGGNCLRELQHVYAHRIDGKTLSASRSKPRSTRTPAPTISPVYQNLFEFLFWLY
jgi:hypothetical protein